MSNAGDTAAGGGEAAAGGAAGVSAAEPCLPAFAGVHFTGGQAGCDNYGGGGGGGWYGGGGGAYDAPDTMGGGGGGSSYVGGTGVTNGVMLQGNGAVPPSTTDPSYLSGVGVGGPVSGTGGNGLVVIAY